MKELLALPLEEKIEKSFGGLVQGGTGTIERSELDGYMGVLSVVPERVNYDYGKMYLNYIYHWIPRTIWPNKPYPKDSMQELISAVPALVNGTSTMLGTYYYNFGLLGVFIGSYITGIILGGLEYWRKRKPYSYSVLLIYLVFFQIGRGIFMSGGLLAGLDSLIPFFVLPVWGAFWYIKIKNRRMRVRKSLAKTQRIAKSAYSSPIPSHRN